MSRRLLNIKECAQATGASPSVLRIWELRYGWPCPSRGPNLYRQYRADIIPQIRAIHEARKKGVPMDQLIRDALPVLPKDEKRGPTRAEVLRPVLDAIPAPDNTVARLLQRRLVDALIAGDDAVVRECQHAASTIHPLHRDMAVFRPVMEAEQALGVAL